MNDIYERVKELRRHDLNGLRSDNELMHQARMENLALRANNATNLKDLAYIVADIIELLP